MKISPIITPTGKKLSKLEAFVWRNQESTFESLATQTNRTPGQIERAAERAIKKMEVK